MRKQWTASLGSWRDGRCGGHSGRESPRRGFFFFFADTLLNSGPASRNVSVEERYIFRWQNNSISGLDVTVIRAEISAHQKGNTDERLESLEWEVFDFPMVSVTVTLQVEPDLFIMCVYYVCLSLNQGVSIFFFTPRQGFSV